MTRSAIGFFSNGELFYDVMHSLSLCISVFCPCYVLYCIWRTPPILVIPHSAPICGTEELPPLQDIDLQVPQTVEV